MKRMITCQGNIGMILQADEVVAIIQQHNKNVEVAKRLSTRILNTSHKEAVLVRRRDIDRKEQIDCPTNYLVVNSVIRSLNM